MDRWVLLVLQKRKGVTQGIDEDIGQFIALVFDNEHLQRYILLLEEVIGIVRHFHILYAPNHIFGFKPLSPQWLAQGFQTGCRRIHTEALTTSPEPAVTSSANFEKNCPASFFAVESIRREPSWAILPPTSALTA